MALLAATSLTWPLWWPWAQATAKNYNLRKAFRYAGLWRTQVLEVSLGGRPRAGGGGGWGLGSTMRTSRFLLGDPGGAQTKVALPYDARFELVREGEPVEVVVLSEEPTFESFKVRAEGGRGREGGKEGGREVAGALAGPGGRHTSDAFAAQAAHALGFRCHEEFAVLLCGS